MLVVHTTPGSCRICFFLLYQCRTLPRLLIFPCHIKYLRAIAALYWSDVSNSGMRWIVSSQHQVAQFCMVSRNPENVLWHILHIACSWKGVVIHGVYISVLKTHQFLPSQQLLIQPQSIVFWTSDSMGCTDKSCCHPALAGIVSFQRPVLFPPMLCHTLEQVIMIINVSSIYFFFKSTSLEGKQ